MLEGVLYIVGVEIHVRRIGSAIHAGWILVHVTHVLAPLAHR